MVRYLICSKGCDCCSKRSLVSCFDFDMDFPGPYAPAVLRFQVTFPDNYPDRPPLIVFKSDIFHPLVTPLTTYTAGAGSSTAASTDSNVRELLPPGGFSLRHMLPHSSLKSDSSEPNVETARSSMDPLSASHLTVDPYQVLGALSLTTSKTRHESLYEVLAYMKSSFEDESVLDALPLSAAGNSGAWHAWQAHRRQVNQFRPVYSFFDTL